MQFSIAALISFFLSLAAVNAASAPPYRRDVPGLNCGTLDALKCAAALGPAVATCVGAAVEAGLNPIADAGCAVGTGNDIINFPESCQNCF